MEKVKISMTDKANEAIIEVITHQYKKDCPEAHKFVQSLGYTIKKVDGSFKVVNEITHKDVSYKYYWRAESIYLSGQYTHFNSKINFVNYLNTPFNDYLYTKNGYGKYVDTKSDAVEKYEKLKMAKHNLEYHNEAILEENKKLQELLEKHKMQIEYHTVSIEKYNEQIAKLRKEYGLTK